MNEALRLFFPPKAGLSIPNPSMTDKESQIVEGSQTLTLRVRSAFGWNTLSFALSTLLSLARSVVVARLVLPAEYGVYGMANTGLAAVAAMTTLGLDSAYVISKRSEDVDRAQVLNTIWTTEFLRRGLISLVLLLAAVPLAAFYHERSLIGVVLLIALVPVLQGLQNPGGMELRKRIAFGRLIAIEQTANIVSLIAIVLVAILLSPTAIALVSGQVIAIAISVLLSYWLIEYRPRFAIDARALKSAWAVGKYISIVAIATFVTTTADNVMVGKLLSARELGVYVLSYTVAMMPTSGIVGIATPVLLSSFSELRLGGAGMVRDAALRAATIGMVALTVCAVPLIVLSHDLAGLAFGAEWSDVGDLLPILAVVGVLRGAATLLATGIVGGAGAVRTEAIAKSIEAATIMALLPVGIVLMGARGAALAAAISYLVAVVLRIGACSRLFGGFGFALLGQWVSVGVAAGIGIGTSLLVLEKLESGLSRLVVGGGLAVGATLLANIVLVPQLRAAAINRARRRQLA